MTNRIRLQTIQFIQRPIHRRIPNKMIHISFLVSRGAHRLIDKRTRPRKRIMRRPHRLGVRERLTAQIRREPRREVLEGPELISDVDGVRRGRGTVLVEDYGEDGLRAAGVLDCLGREEEVLWRGFVVRSVYGGFGCCRGLVAEVFEEEDYAVDGAFLGYFLLVIGPDGGFGGEGGKVCTLVSGWCRRLGR